MFKNPMSQTILPVDLSFLTPISCLTPFTPHQKTSFLFPLFPPNSVGGVTNVEHRSKTKVDVVVVGPGLVSLPYLTESASNPTAQSKLAVCPQKSTLTAITDAMAVSATTDAKEAITSQLINTPKTSAQPRSPVIPKRSTIIHTPTTRVLQNARALL